jgi:endonuclease/exonuclease/phosphatase family metal-dependent hydrolase
MRILTLNLWNITEPLEQRMSGLIAGIRQLQPDITCLQEVSRHPQLRLLQSEIIARECGIAHHAFSLSGCWGERQEGLAILSRYQIARSTKVALPDFAGDGARQVFLAELEVGSHRIVIANTHLAFPLGMAGERESQARALNAAVKEFQKQFHVRPVVICGDLNDQPGSPAVRAIRDGEFGRFDVFASGEESGSTYSSKNPYVDSGLWPDGRIDYIFANAELATVDRSIVFDGRRGLAIVSDHFGLFCKLEFC